MGKGGVIAVLLWSWLSAGAVAGKQLNGGEPLSLNFQDVEVRTVLQVLADFSGFNLVASDAVQGTVTLRLEDVPWEQALGLVLRSKSLEQRMEGNVLLVAPLAEIAGSAPSRRALIPIHHARAADIAEIFHALMAHEAGGASHGSLSVDERTNTLVASQSPERLEELRRLISELDVPVRQVMIEARIVEANVDFEKALGVRWGGAVQLGKGLSLGSGDTFVDLGVDRAAASIGVGLVRNNVLLDLELSAMEKTGNGEIISQPKVVTADKETARILKGTEVPYQETSGSGATSVTFREASLSLEVTPQITADNRVIMAVKVTKDEPDYLNALDHVPAIRKNEVNAKVSIEDGQTIVIGGVYSTVQSKVVDKVPFFGDVPYVGRLFRRDVLQEKKSELLVFLTPRIMSDQAIAVSR
ncbi:type IV pilus secretin PilQ [Pseudomonas rubra]|uniref:Type IV pilus secretin PilQ n=1 Tax=Pseudomonas rubra TaxID=2942627 RepID=A0ABT5P721_9PSED|nr:type IV pilus secretin PilQ [Pseudomonas rubra]MDD1013972.1 type IV pilus secretin PilQ [Pseudomonas rubra]MDD1038906.1 type IV pilus secretin PilQ [Pseudomonas rubra]MDD1154340.1 type IV pilus secretin PilQ [Pseudomonas rubra]